MIAVDAPTLYDQAIRGEPFARTVFPEHLNTRASFWTLGEWRIILPATAPLATPGMERIVKQIREWTGWSARRLADVVRTSHTTILSAENGRPLIGGHSGDLQRRLIDVHGVVERIHLLAGRNSKVLARLLETDRRGHQRSRSWRQTIRLVPTWRPSTHSDHGLPDSSSEITRGRAAALPRCTTEPCVWRICTRRAGAKDPSLRPISRLTPSCLTRSHNSRRVARGAMVGGRSPTRTATSLSRNATTASRPLSYGPSLPTIRDNWGIRSSSFRLTGTEYIRSSSPRPLVSPAVLTSLPTAPADGTLLRPVKSPSLHGWGFGTTARRCQQPGCPWLSESVRP